jgi:hypothetical protein
MNMPICRYHLYSLETQPAGKWPEAGHGCTSHGSPSLEEPSDWIRYDAGRRTQREKRESTGKLSLQSSTEAWMNELPCSTSTESSRSGSPVRGSRDDYHRPLPVRLALVSRSATLAFCLVIHSRTLPRDTRPVKAANPARQMLAFQ